MKYILSDKVATFERIVIFRDNMADTSVKQTNGDQGGGNVKCKNEHRWMKKHKLWRKYKPHSLDAMAYFSN